VATSESHVRGRRTTSVTRSNLGDSK